MTAGLVVGFPFPELRMCRMSELTISAHFVHAALGGAKRHGRDTRTLLLSAGISPELLKEPGSRVTGAQYSHLMQTLWQEMGDEFMGFAPHPSKPGTFATLCLLIVHAANLESAYARARQFYGLFDEPVSLRLRQDDTQAYLSLHSSGPLSDPDHFLQESLLVIWHRLSSWLIGQGITLDQVTFNYPRPAHVDEYRGLFHCQLAFDQPETGLCFPARYLKLPIIRDEYEIKEFLKTSPADLLARPDDRHSHTSQIRAIIGRDFSVQIADFESIAQSLNMSPQTLRRRLRDENTSYQEIKDNLRRDQAIYLLNREDLAINDIAYRIGFTEPSTFHRAFKKWTGVTPGAYRHGERDSEPESKDPGAS